MTGRTHQVTLTLRKACVRMTFSKVRVAVAAIAAGALLASCGGDGGDEQGGAAQGGTSGGGTTKITAILPSGPALLPLYFQWAIAQENGYWEDEGLDVELIGVGSGSASAIQQLVAGKGEVSAESPHVVFDAAEEGFADDIKIIGSWLYAQPFELRTYSDSPVQEIEDLAGEKIGISEAAGGEVSLLKAALTAHGVTDYELVPIGDGSPQTIRALQKQEVAAYSTAAKDFLNIDSAGVKLRKIVIPEWEDLTANVFTARSEFLESNRDAVVGYMRGLAKATVFAHANVDAAIAITKSVQEEGIPEDLVEGWVKQTRDQSVPAQLVADKEIFAVPEGKLDAFLDFYRGAGQIEDSATVDIAAMSDPSLIADINDFDHAAIEEQAKSQ
jgi:NitT/TauT family transport system substrate-binding protein